MVKPKPTQKMVQINFTIIESEKEKWEKYSQDLGFPLARVIKETMNKAIYQQATKSESFNLNLILNEISSIKSQFNDLSQNISKEIDDSDEKINDSQNIPEIKAKIISLLSDCGPISKEKIEYYTGVEKNLLWNVLDEMKKSKSIKYLIDGKKWSAI